jgi:hypothetical protein
MMFRHETTCPENRGHVDVRAPAKPTGPLTYTVWKGADADWVEKLLYGCVVAGFVAGIVAAMLALIR